MFGADQESNIHANFLTVIADSLTAAGVNALYPAMH